MSLLKRSFQGLRQKFFQLFILEFLFVFANFFFLIFTKNRIRTYLSLIQNIPSDAQESVIANFDKVIQNGLIFAFFLVPLIFIIIWIIFQSLVWRVIKDKIRNTKKYFNNFAIGSFILIMSFLVIIYQFLGTEFSEYLDTSMVIIFIISFIFYYILTSFYLMNKGDKLTEEIKHTFNIKRLLKLFPYILLAFIISVSQFFLFLVLFTSYLINDFFFLPPVILVVYIIIILVINLFIKIILQKRSEI